MQVQDYRKPVIEIQNNLRNDIRVNIWYNPTNDKVVIAFYHPSELAGEIIQSGKSEFVKPNLSRAMNTAAPNCCPRCGNEKIRKHGWKQFVGYKRQRYDCKTCGHAWTR